MTGGRPRAEFGIYVPQLAFTYEDVLARARKVEELGFHSLWLYDHLYGPGLPGTTSLEGWTLASFLLAQTERLRVGHLVVCNNFRHPALLAKMATTLDVCSGGRFELGLGSGSVEEEHLRAGLPWGTFAERSERLGEALQIVTEMFANETTTFVGRHYEIHDVPNLPPPVQQPRPPVHVGGMGPRHTLPLVARYADVWNIPVYGLADWEEKQVVLESECAKIGRDPSTIRRSHEAVLVLAEDDESLAVARARAERRYPGPTWGLEAGGYVGTPEMVIDRIAESVERGITFFVFFTHDRADPRTLELFAERVLPAFSR
ncbi:MAG TPA: LLM class flavin-dependent oxidoreductase [Acidimicrobiales bacterium]|nr:LLM class flavin-dependent oxidoreductase [Acidimicrobiales bacterium]